MKKLYYFIIMILGIVMTSCQGAFIKVLDVGATIFAIVIVIIVLIIGAAAVGSAFNNK